ncbi:hypothetical protein [uncultured Rothia sp.]|uniref:hypothetical protein n=1 Tax=uncultured Rothia sp. TaxID=316088 RepID=UPI003216954D
MCVGMGWLSIVSPANDFGVEDHQWLLGKFTDRYIVGIEDMSLKALDNHTIKTLTLGSLRARGTDSAQVNVIALL